MIFFTGSYTEEASPAPNADGKGIGCFRFNEIEGIIECLRYTKQRNPSYITISGNGPFLYAGEELPENQEPQVYSYKISENGKLAKINSHPLKGEYACHLAICQDRLVMANYGSGNALSYPIQNDGSLKSYHQIIQHEGNGPDKTRQESPHVHMVYILGYHHIFLVDLGTDKVKAYGLDTGTKNWKPVPDLDIHLEPGAGARHMIMDKNSDVAYILGELSGQIYIYKKTFDGFIRLQKIGLVPEDYQGAFGGAAIRMHPNGKFLYASNRGPDTISVFKVQAESKRLSKPQHFRTEGKTPRDFHIHPSGKWLIAANQDSNELIVFEIDQNDGALHFHSKREVATPVNICWLSEGI